MPRGKQTPPSIDPVRSSLVSRRQLGAGGLRRPGTALLSIRIPRRSGLRARGPFTRFFFLSRLWFSRSEDAPDMVGTFDVDRLHGPPPALDTDTGDGAPLEEGVFPVRRASWLVLVEVLPALLLDHPSGDRGLSGDGQATG